MNIVILNLETGNIQSVKNVLTKLFDNVNLTDNINIIKKADVIFVAGVSSFDNLVLELKRKKLFEFLKKEKKIKIIGICSGMQIMFNSSEEGNEKGLEIFDNRLEKFDESISIVPHVGWNKIRTNEKDIDSKEFYFCHSYYAPMNKNHTIAWSHYEKKFSSVVKKNNFYGIQFHPEKSNNNGKELIIKLINE